LELKWGTQGAITINDPIYEIFLHVGCCGTMAIKIADSRKFLLKFVGNKNIFGNQDLINNLRGLISSRVKDYISKIMINGKVSFFDMNAHIYDVGLMIQEQLAPVFLEYGIAIELFNIETIDVPREDYDSISKAKELKTSRKIQGFSWQEEKKFEVMDSMAKNEGSGSGIMNAGLGMGVGLGVGGAMGGSFSKLANSVFSDQPQAQPQSVAPESVNSSVENKNVDVNSIIKPSGENVAPSKKYCTNCGQELNIDAKFCSKCGNRV
ncbi:MAG: SPFH domain-containing protein, partial [Clostridia bacterium]